MADAVTMDKIVSLCRRRGFVFPSSEIYGGLGSAYDYGHYGVLLKENVKARWLEAMVQERDDIVALDSSIILHPRGLGGVGPRRRLHRPAGRLPHLQAPLPRRPPRESQCGKRPSKRPGETPDCDLTEARQFNLMFETTVGPVEETGSKVYLRPETAQGIFVNFKNVAQLARRKPPFGIAQVGKSFRNEITPGNFIFRTLRVRADGDGVLRPAGRGRQWYRYWIDERAAWYRRFGLRESHLRVRAHDAGRALPLLDGTSDIEYLFPIGWSELEGIANRGDYDLRAARRVLRARSSSGSTLDRRALRAARDRAGGRRQPLHAGVPLSTPTTRRRSPDASAQSFACIRSSRRLRPRCCR